MVPGALRQQPIPEDAGVGDEPGIEVMISDPGGGLRLDVADVSFESESDGDGFAPATVYRVAEHCALPQYAGET
jgi:hypothetical protein